MVTQAELPQLEGEVSPEQCVYLYCLQREDTPCAIAACQQLGKGVSQLTVGPLRAIVEVVSRIAFSSANLSEPAWLLPRLSLHERVVEEAMASAAVLPSRFGTLFSTPARLRECLGRERGRWLAALERLGDAAEWGIELTGTPSRPGPAPVRASSGPATTSGSGKAERNARAVGPASVPVLAREAGKAFLQAKRAERDRRLAASGEAAGLGRQAFLELSREARDARWLPAPALKATFLVPRDGLAGFHRAVDRLANDDAFEGLAFRLSGPWPPYSFCEVETSKGGPV